MIFPAKRVINEKKKEKKKSLSEQKVVLKICEVRVFTFNVNVTPC